MLFEVLEVEPVVAAGVNSNLEQLVSLANREPLDRPTRSPADRGDRAGHVIRYPAGVGAAGDSQQEHGDTQHGRGHVSESGRRSHPETR